MTTLQIASNYSNNITDTVQTVYTSPATNATVIESFTAANNSGVNASYKAYIVSSNGIEQPQVPFKVVVWGESDLGIGIVNQVIPIGGALKVQSSAIDSIYFTVTGRSIDS